MKAIIVLFCTLLVFALGQDLCPLTEDCTACVKMSGCGYCALFSSPLGGFYACLNSSDCTAANGTTISSCASAVANDLTTSANFQCIENNTVSSSQTIYVAGDERVYFSYNHADIVAHFVGFAGITSPNNPPLLGFQYVAAAASGNPQVNNSIAVTAYGGIGAFWSMLFAVEFYPGPNDGDTFNNNTATFISIYYFTNYTVQSCYNTTSNTGAITYYITYVDPNGWKINCRLANSAILDPNNNPISPVGAKCDFTIGAYPYLKPDTHLGFFTVFFAAGFAAEVVPTPPSIHPCAANPGSSFCLVSESSEYAGQFSYVKTLTSGLTVTVTAVEVYAAAAGQFTAPPAQGTIGSGTNTTTTVNVQAFEAAAFAVFSVKHPLAGDVWDPSIMLAQKSVIDPIPPKSSSTTITYSLFLIIACLFHKLL